MMFRPYAPATLLVVALAVSSAACGPATGETTTEAAPVAAAPIAVNAIAVVSAPVARFLKVTGSLTAEEQAEVAAETAGRVVSTPVDRGVSVADGAELVRLSSVETEAQLKEAEANAAQLEARLGLSSASTFNADTVPEVQSAKASFALAEAEFGRIRSLFDQKVVSQAEFDGRRMQLDATRQQLDAAKNGAAQQYQLLQAARARVSLARKALADTTVRAPFAGLVADRSVSVGDYVSKGTRVASIVRVNPLRIRLTVPEQSVSIVAPGQPVTFEVDAYPGRIFEGTVRHVSPTLEASQRALVVEAVVSNSDQVLKPGFFVTARVRRPEAAPALLVPATAVRTTGGTSRVFVVLGDHVEERIVTVGESADGHLEITSGLTAGDRVATTNVGQLADGTKVS